MKKKLLILFVTMMATWVSEQAFAQCTQTAPWSENFNGTSWTAGTGFSNTGDAIDPCWSRNVSTGYFWGLRSGATGSTTTGPNDDFTGGGNYVFTEGSNGTTGDLALFNSPEIDLTPLTVPEMRFQYHMFGDDISTLNIEISDDGGTSWTNVSSVAGEVQTASSDPWQEQIVNISAYAGQTIQVRFSANKGGTFCDIAIDEMSVSEAPSCPAPSSLAAGTISSSDVELTWTPGNTETNWNIQYGLAGFTLGSGTVAPVTSTTETISFLSSNTTYDFYVQADCGGGDESTWIGPLTVTTECGALVAPWTEGFENAGTIPDCWAQGASNQKDWEFDNTTGFDNIGSDGVINGSTNTNNYFAWLDDSSPHVTGTQLLSPMIDVSGLTTPMLEFFRLSDNQGDQNVDFSVDVWDGSAWNVAMYSSSSNSFNKEWEYIFVDISGLTITGDIQIRFVVDENNGSDISDDVAIDDVGVIEAPTCLQPSQLFVSNVSPTSVDLTWTPNGTETAWNVEYGPAGFTQGNGTVIPAATSTDFPVTGLNPTTSYDFYVQADCGGGDESGWIGSINAFTLIAPVNCASGVNTFLIEAEFENGIPASWTNTATGDPQWEVGTGQTGSNGTGPNGAFSGAEYLFLETTGGTAGDSDTLKGSADLSTGINEAKMYFYYHMYGADMGELHVEVSDDGGTTWTNEFSQVGQVQTGETDPWAPVEIDLTPYLGSVLDYRIIGVRGSGFESDMSIDLFRIETCVSCPQPTALSVSNVNTTSADLDWLAGFSESEWIIEYDTAGFTLGTGNTLVTTSNPESLTGLSDNTTYDVYIRAICGIGDTSVYAGPVSFTTPCFVFSAPFTENFDGSEWVSGTGFDNENSEIGGCWRRNPGGTDFSWGTRTGTTGSGSTGPDTDVSGNGNYVFTEGSNGGSGDTALFVSPVIDLSTVIDPYLGFSYHMHGDDIDSLTVEISNDNGMTWDTIVNIYGEQQTDNSDPWADTSVALTNYNTDNVMIRFMQVRPGSFNADIAIDEFSILPCIGSAGQDGSADVCRFDTLVDLNSAITADQDGTWSFPVDETLIVNGSDLDVSFLPAGDYEAYYIAPGACENDTAVATINVFNASNAGSNGTLTVCLNAPISLFDGLNGTIDVGGTWYDPTNDPLPNSQPTASNIPGSYNFDYITSNGVCPADTAIVEVIVDGDCDWLSIGEEELNEISVYPNPATNVINIVNPVNASALKVEIFDVNGRVVATDDKALENSIEGSIAIDHLETGIYTLRVYGENGHKTFKIVKK